MPLGAKPTCSQCKSTTSSIWRKNPEGEIWCNTCFVNEHYPHSKDNDNCSTKSNGNGNGNGGSSVGSHFIGRIRKSARLKPSKYRPSASKPYPTKGKSRRVIFKKNTIRAPKAVATILTSDNIFHEGQYYQVGDVVSVLDEDGGVYYAQLRGFLQDQYMEKSAVITWLLPTTASPRDRFDPPTYILGPEEDLPRKMECFEFVCHAPSEYYRAKLSPYPTLSLKPDLGYIWTTLGPQIRPVPPKEEIYGLVEMREEDDDPPPVKEKVSKEKKDKDKEKKETREKPTTIREKRELREKRERPERPVRIKKEKEDKR